MSRYSSIVGFPYAAGIGPYNFDSFIASVTVISENNAPNPTVNIVVQTHGIKTNYPLFWSTETVPGSATISAGHFTDNTLTGSFNVDSLGMATITRTARADSTTNGVRIFKIVIRLGNAINGGVMKKSVEITMNDTSLTPLTATLNASVPNPIVQVINVPSRTWELFLPAVTGGRGSSYAYAASGLPTNIGSINSLTGRLSGTPTVTSTTPTSYTVNVTQNYDPAIPFQFAQPASISFNMAVASTLTSARKDVADGETRWLPPSTTITPFIPVQASGGWTGFPAGTLPYNYTFTLNSIPAGLSFNSATGEITGSASATNALTYSVRVEDNATDKQITSGIQFTMRVATVKATTVNLDNRIFVINAPISFKPITYTSTAPTASHTMTGDNNLLMDSVTGIISGTPTAVQASKPYTVTIRDVCRPFQEIATPFNMGFCAILTVSANVSANRYVAVNATITNFTPITYTGGHEPVTRILSPTSPTLRGTLTLDSTSGQISGVAPSTTDASMVTYTIRTTDSSTGSTVIPTRQIIDRTFKLQVVPLLVGTVSIPIRVFVVNTTINYTPITVNVTTPARAFSVKTGTTALPTGLNIISSTGAVTGVPTVSQTSPQSLVTITLTVLDQCSPQQSLLTNNTFQIGIAPLLVVSIVNSIVYIRASTATSFSAVTINGGWTPTGFPLTVTTSTVLPGTLTINTSGVISGTASAVGSLAFTVTAIESSTAVFPGKQTITTNAITLNTVGAMTITTLIPVIILAIGTATTILPVTATGGSPIKTYTSSALPAGLNPINSTNGLISGTPTGPVAAAANYNIIVRDECVPISNNVRTVSIQIVAAMTVAVTNPPTLFEGVTVTAFTPVVPTGGTGTKTFTMDPTTPLPNGLTINSATGQITGTPTDTGKILNGLYKINVSDQCTTPQVKQGTFTINILGKAQKVFDTFGNYTFVVPAGVTSISAVTIGGGGGGGSGAFTYSNQFNDVMCSAGGGGGGGALAYRNNIAVTPGQTIYITVGAGGGEFGGNGVAGGNSFVSTTSSSQTGAVVVAKGGGGGFRSQTTFSFNGTSWVSGGHPSSGLPGAGGTVITGAGGSGGQGGKGFQGFMDWTPPDLNAGLLQTTMGSSGGGGAGGYTGAGGEGGWTNSFKQWLGINGSPTTDNNIGQLPFAGTGGGGGGGGARNRADGPGAKGGGVGLLGLGTNGAAGATGPTVDNTGGTGSPLSGTPLRGYGGGGAGGGGIGTVNANQSGSSGNSGAVRIIWPGTTRSYPSTGTTDQFF
jgi:hypothetical protein